MYIVVFSIQFILSIHSSFFFTALRRNAVHAERYVDKFQEQTKTSAKVDTIEEMQKFIADYPEFQKLSGNVSKHVAMARSIVVHPALQSLSGFWLPSLYSVNDA